MRTPLSIFGLALLMSACGSNNTQDAKASPDTVSANAQTSTTASTTKAATNSSESIWPNRPDSPPLRADIEQKVSDVMAKMSTAEKVGQIIQPLISHVTPEDVKKYHLGSVLNGGGTTPDNNKYATISDWAELADAYYQASMDESDGKVGIPIIWGSDAVHGNNNLFGATLFPHNIGLGAANDPELIERIGEATAMELAVTGLDWTFGPTVAVVRDDRWGRTYESYSESPEIVGAYAKRMIKGIQGEAVTGEFVPGKIIATAKHFLGDGGTTNGIDRGDTAVDEQELMSIHGAGYISALDSNVLTTMASFNSWNGKKLHGHKYLLTDVLKERLGFTGFVVGDWNGHRQVPGCTVVRCPHAINAGLDMFMVPEDWRELYANTLKDVENGDIPASRLDDAVRRILRVKFLAGLFNAGRIKDRPQLKQADMVGSEKHRLIAREAVRKSLVLLKNNDQVLPIMPKQNVLVAGQAAHNIGQQAGGWTLSWQGTGNTNKDFPGATSIYQGLSSAIKGTGGEAILSEDGNWQKSDFSNQQSPDVAIVVIGEEPYAEWHGDLANIEYQYGLKADLALLKKLKADGIPVVTVFISGRPLWVNKELNASDAFVAAWLPGTEGAGIADVIVADNTGKAAHDFQGRLSFSWPKRMSQNRLNRDQDNYDPLFPYGYGLTYAEPQEVSNNLNESSARKAQDPIADIWVFVSRTNSPWEIELRASGKPAVTVRGNSEKSGDGNLALSSVDKDSQEDARRLQWLGAGTLAFTTPMAIDLNDLQKDDGAIQFDIKVNKQTVNDLSLGLGCEPDCKNEVPLTGLFNSEHEENWHNVNVKLACFSDDGGILSKVSDIFVLQSSSPADVSVANIKVVKGDSLEGSTTLNCN